MGIFGPGHPQPARLGPDEGLRSHRSHDLRYPVAPIAAITPRLRQLTAEVRDAARRLAGTVDHSSVPE
ncbi:hypothetical protein [Nocardia pneumoniae]|uniref:hypothetical protein n=1 Tax=Nocardia pneumoniae TaxID=228601 RepID=UPI000594C692|nr:hypothetical protein [Nocardia pneumoniae]